MKDTFEGISPEWLPFCDYPHEHYVIVFADRTLASHVYSIFKLRMPAEYLDFFASDIYETAVFDYDVFKRRATTLTHIANRRPKIVITDMLALNYKVADISFFSERINITKGSQYAIPSLINDLVNFGYMRTAVVNTTGTFAVRGGIVDVYIPDMPNPVRLEFIGNKIESIKAFDKESQLSTKELETIELIKCSEIILNEETLYLFKQKYKFNDERTKETIANGNYFPGIEWFQSCFHEKTVSVLDYFPKDTKFIFDFELQKHNEIFFEKCETKYKHYTNVLPIAEIFTNAVNDITKRFGFYELNPFSNNSKFKPIDKKYNIRNEIELHSLLNQSIQNTVFSLKTNGSYNITKELLKNNNIKEITNFLEMEKDKLNIIISDLNNGFISDKLSIYTELNLFGEELKFARKKTSKDFFKDYSKLSLGDFVVHEKHGIAIFDGLVNLDVSGVSHDFIVLRYQNNDKLYIPIENINLVSRYGDADSNVQLDYLKSNAWINRKQRVHKKLLVIANDLLQLAAKRKMQKIKPFEIPDDYEKFCKGFGHIETEDQLSAIDDVICDLTSETPMDRLICGDVGFGKTEVALRASFIVASSLKQVVLLAPTTILVSQHYKNFQKRFENFGIKVCQLSRFVPKTCFQQNLADIKSGQVQIIIATHAILSEKIEFADLGLVIIDEEQHFGVKQKEFLKKHHETTHFMTLSATPIPRTLQLAMSGVKELSMITTPPTDRLPVKTLLCDYDSEALRQAIEHEIKIGGQVFVVTPRIELLDEIYARISKLFPELRIAKVHGKTATLEEILRDFCDCKIDVLVSTNIIDSGIDIPNANTILIHRFDLFGLSQLYQLRGRVGRSKRQAYAYLLLDKTKVLNDTAKKRLEVLSNLNKLGAGFNLASHDLDIRGAGNLLGEEQSGYIKEIGVELYQSMLQEAILMLKSGQHEEQSNKREIQINLGVPALIPEYYISDSALRLEMYRRIGAIDTETAVEAMEYELSDRFGVIPFEVTNLLILIKIRLLCMANNIEKLDIGTNGIIFSFYENKCKNIEGLMKFLNSGVVSENSGSFKIRNDQKIVILKKWKDIVSRTNDVLRLMRELYANM